MVENAEKSKKPGKNVFVTAMDLNELYTDKEKEVVLNSYLYLSML